ncbi:hypothetical protein MMC11_005789 [Xylographa trunciseda]|nr:hypothetical protein [Xylographa trunciseda]
MEVAQKFLQRPYFWLTKASWNLDSLDWVIALVLALLVLVSWPSSGGVIIKNEVDAVELMFLGLDRLNPQMKRDIDPAVEDAFGRELRKIGGKWWRSEQRSLDVTVAQGNGREPTAEERKMQVFGWPSSGGLLVLELESHEEMPEDIGRLTLAFTMEERCRLLEERFHAMLYKDPREYEGLADVWTKDGYEMEAL